MMCENPADEEDLPKGRLTPGPDGGFTVQFDCGRREARPAPVVPPRAAKGGFHFQILPPSGLRPQASGIRDDGAHRARGRTADSTPEARSPKPEAKGTGGFTFHLLTAEEQALIDAARKEAAREAPSEPS